MAAVQTSYAINPERGFLGGVARPTEPHSLDYGELYVASNVTREPRPGDAVVWNASRDAFAVPTTAAQARNVVGILSYRADEVANDSNAVRFKSGDGVQVGVFGTFWAQVGEAVEYDDAVIYDAAGDNDWVKFDGIASAAVTTVDNTKGAIDNALAALKEQIVDGLRHTSFTVVSPQPVAANGIAQVRIGFGRIT